MKTKTIALSLGLILAAGALYAADPMEGAWKLNESKSKLTRGTAKYNKVVYDSRLIRDKVTVTGDGVDADGKPVHTEWKGKFNGKDYEVTGDPNADMRSYTKVNDQTLNMIVKKGGKVRESDDELVAQNRGEDRKSKENTCKNETEKFLRTLWSENPSGIVWNKAEDPDICLRIIARCARLLAALRGAINVWHTDEGGERLSHNVPVIEKPNRINCLLYNLARGHAIICGRRQLTAEDLWPVLEVTFDSAPVTRAKLFRGLIEAGGLLTTTKVEKLLNCSPPTARKEMEALSVLGVADKTFEDPFDPEDPLDPGRPETQITLKSRFDWFISPDCKALMSGVTDPRGGNLFNIPPDPGIKKGSPPCICVDVAVADQKPATETSSQTPQAQASVPVMLTRQMEANLRRRGFTQAEINRMTPQQANNILVGEAPENAQAAVAVEDTEGEL